MDINEKKLLSSIDLEIEHLNIPNRRFPVDQYFRLYQVAADATGNLEVFTIGTKFWPNIAPWNFNHKLIRLVLPGLQ